MAVSCDGRKLYPNCSYCPQLNNTTAGQGCNGNCEWDAAKGECKEKSNSKIKIWTKTIEHIWMILYW